MNRTELEKIGGIKRKEHKEKAFKKRYGKNVKVETLVQDKDNNHVIITHNTKEYIISEHLKDGLTDYALVSYDGKIKRYPMFILAELDVADNIGETNGERD